MNAMTTSTIPAALLNPMPPDYKIPAWRWILLPASAWMLSRNKGAWVGGEFSLRETDVHFIQKGLIKSKRAAEWKLALSAIDGVTLTKRMASDVIEIHHGGEITKVMSVRSDEFVARFQAAVAQSRVGA